jgi:Rrf2 family protein
VAQIGEKYGASNHHLAKVMHVLNRAGLVRAVRGAGGGYQFSGNARRTTVLDVIQLFESLGTDAVHPLATGSAAETRALSEILDEIDDIVRATLGSITLATMLKSVERHRGARLHADHGG